MAFATTSAIAKQEATACASGKATAKASCCQRDGLVSSQNAMFSWQNAVLQEPVFNQTRVCLE